MGFGSSGHPGIPAPNLTDIGRGRFLRLRRVARLERREGIVWTVVGRYGSIRDANVALDEEIGNGVEPDSLRVVEAQASTASRVLLIVGAVVLVLGIMIVLLYVLLD